MAIRIPSAMGSGALGWWNQRRGYLLLGLVLLIGTVIIYYGYFAKVEEKEAVLLYEESGSSAERWDDNTSYIYSRYAQDDNTAILGNEDNLTGLVKILPDAVTRISFWVFPHNNTGLILNDDIPVHVNQSSFNFILGGSEMQAEEGIGINYSSISLHYAYVILEEGDIILGVAERGYSHTYEIVGNITYGEWFNIDVTLSEGCIKATLDFNKSKNMCGEFEREGIGFEFRNNSLDNLSIYGYPPNIITQSATTMGFEEVVLPSYFVMCSSIFSIALIMVLIVVLRENHSGNSTRIFRFGSFFLLIWAIVLALIMFSIIIL